MSPELIDALGLIARGVCTLPLLVAFITVMRNPKGVPSLLLCIVAFLLAERVRGRLLEILRVHAGNDGQAELSGAAESPDDE